MAEQMRRTIAEVQRSLSGDAPEVAIYHLPVDMAKVDVEEDCIEIKCGGFIALPGWSELVPESHVCADCLAGRKTKD